MRRARTMEEGSIWLSSCVVLEEEEGRDCDLEPDLSC